ncbi:MAG: putative 2-aminoethylphosphonate ABC transporter ATP-binding protein [Betaproteobacteria bacterium]|nr:putative 2-aminoethylphosphonate ABC transporter ATP-binding protein [Betaproteobacteria bacterium]
MAQALRREDRGEEVVTAAAVAQPYVEVRGVSKRFGDFAALDRVSFEIARGEFVCFLGPSGCGKTTLLRCIAGLELQSEGSIVQGGVDISWLPPSRRDFGIVFQSYALFPNLSAAQNIGFGLVNAGRPAGAIRERVAELVELVGLAGQEGKFPAQLSGGQQQRVALARALAPSPGLLLLDEPLSALDAKVRARLRREIREVQTRLGVTTIMVTHDQEEAQTMADRIVVLRDGHVEQIGTPADVYDEPASPFVADFIGVMNFIDGSVTGADSVRIGSGSLAADASAWDRGAQVSCAFRPEDVAVGARGAHADALEAIIVEAESLGAFVRLYLRLDGGAEVRADVQKTAEGRPHPRAGESVSLRIPANRVRLFRKSA